MIVNCFIIKHLADELNANLAGGKVIDCFSPGKDDFVLNFKYNGKVSFMKVTFVLNQPWFRFGKDLPINGKNSITQFKPILEAEIEKVDAVDYDRTFYMRFTNGYVLLFKCHGTSSNIFLFKDSDPDFFQYFRKLKENETVLLHELLPKKNNFRLSEQLLQNEKECKNIYPFLGDAELAFLNAANLFTSNLDGQHSIINSLKNQIYEKGYSIVNHQLSLLEYKLGNRLSPTEFLNESSENFIRNWYTDQRKNSALNEWSKEIKKKKSYLKQCLQKQHEAENRISFKEMGDLLMAHLTEIEYEAAKFKGLSFDGETNVIIHLDSKLTPIQNAERYYKKSKNEHREIQLLADKIKTITQEIGDLESKLTLAEKNEFVFVKKENKKQNAQEVLPYHIYKVDGFELRVGKNAKSNDELLSKHSQKHHLWLHARSVAGSHSIVVLNPGQILPAPVLEKIAGISAWFSKAKTQSLVPVIYTERKYVRKPKGAMPGAVVVEKEKVILVAPTPPEKLI